MKPIEIRVESSWFQRLKQKYDELLSVLLSIPTCATTHRLDKIELALSIRVIDSLPFKRMVGTGEHRLNLREEEEEEEVVVPGAKNQKRKIKKLKVMKTKPLTAEEIRDIDAKGMESTASEAGGY